MRKAVRSSDPSPFFMFATSIAFSVSLALALLTTGISFATEAEPLVPRAPGRLPPTIDGRPVTPDIGCFWSFKLDENDYKGLIDAVAPTNAFDVLLITQRNLSFFDDNKEAVETTNDAVRYAKEKYGIGALLDLDLRIARYDFEKARPDLAQERLIFDKKNVVDDAQTVNFTFESSPLNDHYSSNHPYYVRGARVVRAWACQVDENGVVVPSSIQDVTESAKWVKDQRFVKNTPGYDIDETVNGKLSVSFDKTSLPEGVTTVAVAVAFRYSYPDLFADETLELEKRLYEQYRNVPALGGCKDEWGFLPNFNRNDALNDYWYSEKMAQAYSLRFDGRDLVNDLFLAYQAQKGREQERVAAVDRFRRLCADRVVEFEIQNYNLNKEIWGANAFVGVHNSWFPWPNCLEMRKNGIMWWRAPRDVAQTDEHVPFCVRNSLAKGCGSLWVNMFYAAQTPPYVTEHWTAAASGGRVHIHQIYPRNENSPQNKLDPKLLPIVSDAGVNKIREKIRMLNLISTSQIDSPVAVVFGRFGAANPLRPEYLAVGVDICDRFSLKGYPADLIPVDEIASTRPNGAPKWNVKNSRLAYGDQEYEALLLYGENEVEKESWDALRALVAKTPGCKTKLVDVPAGVSAEEKDRLAEETITLLERAGVLKQTPWVADPYVFSLPEESSTRPPRTAFTRFLDGSLLWIAASESDFGDPIVMKKEKVELKGGKVSPEISVEANGVFSVRFDETGKLDAVVASDVKSLSVGDLSFNLSENEVGDDPVDVAIWKDSTGAWRGVFQRKNNNLPESLQKLIPVWNYLKKV